ncbi:MAG: EF-hand domain-containing protein [Deltaproteobacteria bacterium]|nr:EF-hand domain-containing protein [Deltaproteobacteria bacterium]
MDLARLRGNGPIGAPTTKEIRYEDRSLVADGHNASGTRICVRSKSAEPCGAGVGACPLFAQADADGSGTLSLSEFKTFESLIRDKMTEQHFNHLDTNGDGVLGLDELPRRAA